MASTVAQTGSNQVLDRLAELDPTCQRGLLLIAIRSLANEDDARDAVQEILARAVEALRGDRIPADVPVPRFVQGIARHVIADIVRHRVRRRFGPLDTPDLIPAAEPSALDAIVSAEERQALGTALGRLAPDEQDLLRRCYVDGRPLAEIAGELGVSSERIRKRKSRALERLRAWVRPIRHDSPPRAADRT